MTPPWVQARAIFSFARIDPARTALLVIDLQRGFIDPEVAMAGRAVDGAEAVIRHANRLAMALRAAGGTVAFIRHTGSDDPALSVPAWQKEVPGLALLDSVMRPGQSAHRLDPRLDVTSDDLIVDKYRYSAFIRGSSDLEALLGERGIDTLIVTGAFTNFCCESTARDAMMLGYRVIFVGDATLARTPEEHEMGLIAVQLAFADLRTADATIALIAACTNAEAGERARA